MQSIIIGTFNIWLDDNGNVEFRTFNQTDRNTLSAQEAVDLLQWLYEQRDTLVAGSHQDTSEQPG